MPEPNMPKKADDHQGVGEDIRGGSGMSDDEHQKIIAMIRWQGVPVRYKRTIFGNYSPNTVVQIVLDALACYRDAMKREDRG